MPGELWAGSDDGLVWVTRDDGATWEDVTPPGLPIDGTVNTLDISTHRPDKVTIAVHRYRMDDWAPYVFQTEDGGTSWEQLANGSNGIPADYSVRTVREDPEREGLLYAGTEFGLFVSFDDGTSWESLQLNLPVTPVTEMVVHEKDLVVSTQGRGIWILDDLTPLHQLTDETPRARSVLLEPRPAIRAAGSGGRPAAIHYRVPADGTATLEILDPRGGSVRFWSTQEAEPRNLSAGSGINRLIWDLRYPGTFLADDAIIYLGYNGGPLAVPGSYTVRLTGGGQVLTQPLEVLSDPRRPDVTEAHHRANFALSEQVRDLLQRTQDGIKKLRAIRDQAVETAGRARAAAIEGADDLSALAEALAARLTSIEEQLIQTKAEARQDPINFPPMLGHPDRLSVPLCREHLRGPWAARLRARRGAPSAARGARGRARWTFSGPLCLLSTRLPRLPASAPSCCRRAARDDDAVAQGNGRSGGLARDGGFAVFRRDWAPGDTLHISLNMAVRRVAAHPGVSQNAGKLAIQRGPLVYAAEAIDNSGSVRDLVLPPDAELTARFDPDLLGGLMVIEGTALRDGAKVPFMAIPYFAWANRGAGEMAVWLPTR